MNYELRTMNDFAKNSISRIKTRICRKSKSKVGGKSGEIGGFRGIFEENRVHPPLRIDMTHLVGFRKGLPRPANQWTLGRPSADVHTEKRPAEVHQSRPNLSALCVLCGKKSFVANQKMSNKPNLVRLWRICKPSSNKNIQQKSDNGHLVKTNPISGESALPPVRPTAF